MSEQEVVEMERRKKVEAWQAKKREMDAKQAAVAGGTAVRVNTQAHRLVLAPRMLVEMSLRGDGAPVRQTSGRPSVQQVCCAQQHKCRLAGWRCGDGRA
jgi:hypothetical protein